jgi:hypothetical protein
MRDLAHPRRLAYFFGLVHVHLDRWESAARALEAAAYAAGRAPYAAPSNDCDSECSSACGPPVPGAVAFGRGQDPQSPSTKRQRRDFFVREA